MGLVSLSNIASDCNRLLNASEPAAYTTATTDPRWSSTQVANAVLEADSQVVAAIIKNKSNPRSRLYYADQVGLATGAELGLSGFEPAGPIASVSFAISTGDLAGTWAGALWDKTEIFHENINVLDLSFDPHYFLDGMTIWHNGEGIAVKQASVVTVSVRFPFYTQGGACQAPAEYSYAVLCGAMSLLVDVEGENPGPHGTWAQQFQSLLQMIATGTGDVPLGG
jgi:hypothetical protein